ncbi:flavin reductase-like protein [Novosphingobium sp. Rr 2-17]|uniref:flavin reductase family protein n=1 Tax=Novosphingobium sp. Rr 2-17 TaxID=555793 RepID=UPI000269A879|nr:flavin reductase family protein [Novosphingobium sp. Rr 2-17]EIZ77806.1 flavin reductase-like protein [Novosphingobium sp. Rr 2-17]
MTHNPSSSIAAKPVDRAAFLLAMRAVPGAVAIIASSDGKEMTGMAATAWNSLCADPPTILVCINLGASVHAVIHCARRFTVNLVPSNAAETVAIFSAQRGLSGRDRFVDGQWSSSAAGQPMLNSAVVSFECDLSADHVHATHSIFIGQVGETRSNLESEALLYFNGAYGRSVSLD